MQVYLLVRRDCKNDSGSVVDVYDSWSTARSEAVKRTKALSDDLLDYYYVDEKRVKQS